MRAVESFDGPPGPRARVAWPLLAFAALDGLLFAIALVVGAQFQPYADQLAYISSGYSLWDHQLSFPEFLWLPSVGHHIVWVRLLTALDMGLKGSLVPQMLAALAAMIGLAGVCASSARWAAAKGAAPFAMIAAAALVLTAYNGVDIVQTGNIVYAFGAFFGAAALFTLCRGGRDAPDATSWAAVSLAILLAALATLGNAAGFAVWPGLVLCVLTGQGSRQARLVKAAVLVLAGAAWAALYFSTAGAAGDIHGAGAAGRAGIVHRAVYFLTFLGNPYSRIAGPVGALVGAVLLAAFGVIAFRSRGEALDRSRRLAWGLVAFALTAAFLAAVGRADLGMDRAPVRYGVFASLLHVALLILVVRTWKPTGSPAWKAGPVALLALLAVTQIVGALELRTEARKADGRVAAFRAGDHSPGVASFVYPDAIAAEQLFARMDKDGLYQVRRRGR